MREVVIRLLAKADNSYNNISQNTSFIAKTDNCRSRFTAECDISISANHRTECEIVNNNGCTHSYYFEVLCVGVM